MCGSVPIYKDGFRYSKLGKMQRYLCRVCGYRFYKSSVKLNVTRKISKSLNPRENHHEVRVASGDATDEKINDCLPFVPGEDVSSHDISIAENSLYGLPFYNSKRQLCAIPKEAKKLDTATETKTVAGESPQLSSRGKIIEHGFWLLKQAYSEATIKSRIKHLNRLLKLGADFDNGDSVKAIIATQKWTVSSKVNAVDAYDSLLRMLGKT